MKQSGDKSIPPLGGTLTFLALDIDGTDYVYNQAIDLVGRVMDRYRKYLEEIAAQHSGVPIKDFCFAGRYVVAFPRPTLAVQAAFKLNRTVAADEEFHKIPVFLRMAIATGEVVPDAPLSKSPVLRRVDALEKKVRGEQIVMTLATQDIVRDLLPEEFSYLDLGTVHLASSMRAERVFQLLHADLPATFPPLEGAEVPGHNIPPRLTFFLGREQEIEEVKIALDTGRILTLVGPGGVGKTSLAARVAIALVEDYPDGVRFFDLTRVQQRDQVVLALAETLRLRQRPGMTLEETVFHELGPKQMLLLFDNCELAAGELAGFVEDLLRACASAQILATSRRPLRAEGESVYSVPTLGVPPVSEVVLEEIAQYDAVALLVDRITSQKPSFVLHTGNVGTIVAICRRLDGIPLAIELAAKATSWMSLDEVLASLDDRFSLLDNHPGQRERNTLGTMVDWSYSQLQPRDQMLFRRLSVFAGGWTLESAIRVCAGDGLTPADVKSSLDRLVENSMAVRMASTSLESSYGFLETIREFAKERLRDSGEELTIRDRHCEWCMEIIAADAAAPDKSVHSEVLDMNRDNIRAAQGWTLREGADPAAAYAFVTACHGLWIRRTWLADGREFIERLLAFAPDVDSPERGRALNVLGVLLTRQGDLGKARAYLYNALRMYERMGMERGIAAVYSNLAANSLHLCELNAAILEYEECIGRLRGIGDTASVYRSLTGFAEALLSAGYIEKAAAAIHEAKLLALEVPDAFVRSNLQFCEGDLLLATGDSSHSEVCFKENAQATVALGNFLGFASCLRRLSYVALRHGSFKRAALLLGCDQRCRDSYGIAIVPLEAPRLEQALVECRIGLGTQAFEEYFSWGVRLTLQEMLSLALADGILPE
jgi:predicted ATPase